VDQDRNDIRLIVLGANHGATALSFVVAVATGGTDDDFVGKGPRIIAINNAGKEWIVQQFTSLRKARNALALMQAELHRIGRSAWFKAHDVPSDFDTWGENQPG
jgi:hypothetical protein